MDTPPLFPVYTDYNAPDRKRQYSFQKPLQFPSSYRYGLIFGVENKTRRLVIYYKFVGYLDINPTQCHPNYTADIREGVAIEYVSCEPSDSLKELFSEGYNADDDSFEEAKPEQA